MIKFFRKIRQTLLSEGKTGKYFKYAIGEIVLVVIGILIALQINNASQQKTNRQQIESILKSIYYNLESDMANPINRFIEFCEFKDSLNTMVLSKDLSYEDYESSGQGPTGLGRLLNYEFEPFQFKSQAYERMMANIEIIPNEYMPVVEMLQDVYGNEVPVVNEVAIEIKIFVDEIDDKYQATYDWFSDTDSLHFRQKVDYMINNPKHLNDVRRHQFIINHLMDHLNTLKTNVAIAYSKIHKELMFDKPFSKIIEPFYFPTEDELEGFVGTYKSEGNPSRTIQFLSKDYYLTPARNGNGVKLVKIGVNKFAAFSNTKGNYFEFIEDENDITNAFILNIITERDTTSVRYNKIE